jgi:Tol biopolymer transport system component
MRMFRASAVSSVALIALITFGTNANATFPGRNGRIAFSSNRSGSFQIYTMNPDGSRLQQLTSAPGNSIFSDWDPDGDRIAFDSDRTGNVDIFTMRPNGSHVRNLTSNDAFDGDPAWSPNERNIAFESDRGGIPPEIYVMRRDGSNLKRLTHNSVGDFNPAWSPDGRWIAFEKSIGDGLSAVLIMRSDGSHVSRITPSRIGGGVPDWSPNGRWIVFASNAEAPGTSKIYVVHPDGSGLKRLTNPTQVQSDFFPSWSPNGDKIVISHQDQDNVDIATINRDGTHLRLLTRNPSFDIGPDWGSPPTED